VRAAMFGSALPRRARLAFVLLHFECVNTDSSADARLSYLDAECVRGPFHTYRDFSVWNDDDGNLGRLDGIRCGWALEVRLRPRESHAVAPTVRSCAR